MGVVSTTDDEEGEKQVFEIKSIPEVKNIKKVIAKFKGRILQTPSIFSAIKVHGQEAYKLARKGKAVPLSPRMVKA